MKANRSRKVELVLSDEAHGDIGVQTVLYSYQKRRKDWEGGRKSTRGAGKERSRGVHRTDANAIAIH